ncbi:MAG TPA: STAS domain-containing protein [Gaiellaceae bacterium]|nr:STAS domain-containing protein [Gaiellaceae bacterium]
MREDESIGGAGGSHDGLREPPVKEVVENGTALVVRLAGELDLYNADAVREALADAMRRQPERVVVDLGDVRFIDSTALGILVEARSRLENRHAFVLAAPGPETTRALEVSGLDRHFDVRGSVDDALAG